MSTIKMIWPTPFKITKGDVASFLIQLVIFIVVVAVFGWLCAILAHIPIVGILFKLISAVLGIYNFVGIVLCVLKFLGVLE